MQILAYPFWEYLNTQLDYQPYSHACQWLLSAVTRSSEHTGQSARESHFQCDSRRRNGNSLPGRMVVTSGNGLHQDPRAFIIHFGFDEPCAMQSRVFTTVALNDHTPGSVVQEGKGCLPWGWWAEGSRWVRPFHGVVPAKPDFLWLLNSGSSKI